MATWLRQHSESRLYRLPWHLDDPNPPRAPMVGLRVAACGTSIAGEDHGVETTEGPPLGDRCPVCQAELVAGRAG